MATNNFDPLKYGATPVTKSPGTQPATGTDSFNPLSAGATPVDPRTHLVANQQTQAAKPKVGNFFTDVGNQIGSAFKSGIDQASQGIRDAKTAGLNPIKQLESVLKIGSGLSSSITAPLAPLFKPVGNVINDLGNAIAEDPGVQRFAESKAGQITSRVAEDVSNAANLAGTVAGGVELAPKISKLGSSALDTALETAKTKASSSSLATARTNLQTRTIQGLSDAYDELFSATKSAGKTLNKSLAAGKDPGNLLAQNGYVVDTVKTNGRYTVNAQPTIKRIQTEQIAPLGETLKKIFAEKDKTLGQTEYKSLDELATNAKARAVNPKVKGSGTLPDVHRGIDSTIAKLKNTYGDSVNLSQMNEIKSGQWSQVGTYDPTSPNYMGDVNRALGQAAAKTLENAVPEAAVKAINAAESDWFNTIDNLKKVDGNVVKGGKIGSYTNRVIGALIGSHFGPLGAFAGEEIGGHISDILQSQTLTNPIKTAILESIPKDSSVYAEAQRALNQIKYGQKLLPASSGGANVRNATPIELPAKTQSTLDAQELANMKRTRVMRPTGSSTNKPVTQVFGGASNVSNKISTYPVEGAGSKLPPRVLKKK